MRKFVLLLVTLAVLGMSTAGYATAYGSELLEAAQHGLDTDEHDDGKSLHGSSHSCHIGAHLTALPSASLLPPAPRVDRAGVPLSVGSPPAVFLDLPLRPPRAVA
jgi:hypothetical protein